MKGRNTRKSSKKLCRTTISLPEEVMKVLEARATQDGRSVSGYVQKLVRAEETGELKLAGA